MARSENQKQKIMVLLDIFRNYTDEEHGITMSEIINLLAEKNIKADRRTIYSDIDLLTDYGYEIEHVQTGSVHEYCLVDRNFELPELKLLVDAVQASKFISQKKSNELIKKIEEQASIYQARELQRQVYVANRIKTSNEGVLYNIDAINEAINHNKKIDFQYYEWNLKKELVLKANGDKTNISPWALMWDDENYYLVAFDEESGLIKHYRVDKIKKIVISDQLREGKEQFEKFDMAVYAKKVFGMFTGKEENVKIQFRNELIGVVLDRFGHDAMIIPKDDDHFTVNVKVNVSNMFFGWLIGLGNGAKILEPQSVVEQLKQEIKRLNEQYE